MIVRRLALAAALLLALVPAGAQQITVVPQFFAPGQYPGVSGNTAATAGNIGEVLTGTVGATGITTSGVIQNLTSVSLTAGSWAVACAIRYSPAAATTVYTLLASASTANNQNGSGLWDYADNSSANTTWGAGAATLVKSGPLFVALSGTQIYYCNAYAVFGVSTLSATASIQAVRVH